MKLNDCKCPVPCSEVIFTPSLSYSALSDVKLKQLLMHESIIGIQNDYDRALETKEQVVLTNRFADILLHVVVVVVVIVVVADVASS